MNQVHCANHHHCRCHRFCCRCSAAVVAVLLPLCRTAAYCRRTHSITQSLLCCCCCCCRRLWHHVLPRGLKDFAHNHNERAKAPALQLGAQAHLVPTQQAPALPGLTGTAHTTAVWRQRAVAAKFGFAVWCSSRWWLRCSAQFTAAKHTWKQLTCNMLACATPCVPATHYTGRMLAEAYEARLCKTITPL